MSNRVLFERYLSLLGVSIGRPDLGALREVVSAHLVSIPFENISKLYSRLRNRPKTIPSLEQFLNGIEKYNFGGTCYANNYYLNQLLNYLGYRIKLCGADMAGSQPNVHMVSVVTVGGREFIVDVGYGAPFWHPLPRDLVNDHLVELGRDTFVVKPQDARGGTRVEYRRQGELKHGYYVKPQPLDIAAFAAVIAASYADDAPFMNALSLTRFSDGTSFSIKNHRAIESSRSGTVVRILRDRHELLSEIRTRFQFPENITRDVLAGLNHLIDIWS